jgi:hypothetical protein
MSRINTEGNESRRKEDGGRNEDVCGRRRKEVATLYT